MTSLQIIIVISVLVIHCVNCFHTSRRAQELKIRERRTAWDYLTRSVERHQPFGFVLSISPKCNSCQTKITNETESETTTTLFPIPEETTTILSSLETKSQQILDSSLEGQDFTQNTNIYPSETTVETNLPPIESSTFVEPSAIDPDNIWTDLSVQENPSDSFMELNQDLPINEFIDNYKEYDEASDGEDDDYYGDISLPDPNTTEF